MVIDQLLKDAICSASEWTANLLNDYEGTQRNWLHIQGSLGRGKTTLARAIGFTIMAHSKWQFTVKEHPAMEVARYARQEDLQAAFERICNERNVMSIDDLGTEAAEVMCFGNMIQPMVEVFNARYSRNRPMIYTTNLNGEALMNRYGDRVLDRMREKAVIITLQGDSYRQ